MTFSFGIDVETSTSPRAFPWSDPIDQMSILGGADDSFSLTLGSTDLHTTYGLSADFGSLILSSNTHLRQKP